jgi:heme A synthase
MKQATTRSFRRLSIAAAMAVYLLMVVGGIVRITDSGLGCPDWPLCHGRLIPPFELTAIIEYSHRSVALIGGVLVIAVALVAWRKYLADRWVSLPAVAVIALLVIQIPLGALVVATDLRPMLVAFHLAMAMLIFACSLISAVAANRSLQAPSQRLTSGYRTLLTSTLIAVFMLMVTGALVVSAGASHICAGWPLCEGGNGLFGVTPAEVISMYHRYVVAAVSILVIATVIATLRGSQSLPAMRGWAMMLGGLFTLQVIIGAVQVSTGLPTLWRILHLATATGVWASLVALMGLTLLNGAAFVEARRRSGAVVSSASK